MRLEEIINNYGYSDYMDMTTGYIYRLSKYKAIKLSGRSNFDTVEITDGNGLVGVTHLDESLITRKLVPAEPVVIEGVEFKCSFKEFLDGIDRTHSRHIILHHFDADGYGSAAALAYGLWQSNIDYENITRIACGHNYPISLGDIDIDSLTPSDRIYILDYSFSREDDQALITDLCYNRNIPTIWIDHHATSIDIAESNDIFGRIANIDITHAATYLTWLWIREATCTKDTPKWVTYVSDSDTHAAQDKMVGSGEFSIALSDMGLSKAFFNDDPDLDPCDVNTDLFDNDWVSSMVKIGASALELRAKMNKSLLNSMGFEVDLAIDGNFYKCLALNARGNSSVFGDHFLEYDAVILFTYDGSVWTYSMFSKKDGPDVSPVALHYLKTYGISGGGHKHACGWVAPLNIFEGMSTKRKFKKK